MKKFLAIAALTIATGSSAFAGSFVSRSSASPASASPASATAATEMEATNAKAATKFNADFKGATGIWNNEKDFEEVLFFWHGQLMDAFYDRDGNMIGTFHEIQKSDLPAKAAEKIANWYKGYDVKYMAAMESDTQDTLYYVTVQSASHLRILEVAGDGSVKEFKTIR
jgi:hypothetical protein